MLTFDGRGNGRSDRPVGAAAYQREFAADALAVMDATGTERAVLAGILLRGAVGHGAGWHPDRVAGVIVIGPAVSLAPPHPERAAHLP